MVHKVYGYTRVHFCATAGFLLTTGTGRTRIPESGEREPRLLPFRSGRAVLIAAVKAGRTKCIRRLTKKEIYSATAHYWTICTSLFLQSILTTTAELHSAYFLPPHPIMAGQSISAADCHVRISSPKHVIRPPIFFVNSQSHPGSAFTKQITAPSTFSPCESALLGSVTTPPLYCLICYKIRQIFW